MQSCNLQTLKSEILPNCSILISAPSRPRRLLSLSLPVLKSQLLFLALSLLSVSLSLFPPVAVSLDAPTLDSSSAQPTLDSSSARLLLGCSSLSLQTACACSWLSQSLLLSSRRL